MEFMTHDSNPTHNTQKTNFASLAHLTLQRQTINVAATATWKAAEPVPHLSPKWLSKNEHSQLKTQCECWVESQAALFCLFLLLHMPETKKNTGEFADRHIRNNAFRSFFGLNIWFVQRLCDFFLPCRKCTRKKTSFWDVFVGIHVTGLKESQKLAFNSIYVIE